MKLEEYITEGKKKVSAAVLMSDGNRFLVVHPTGAGPTWWELPKGMIDDGENAKQAAVREFYEETGVKINMSNLRKVGKFSLRRDKDIILFTYSTDELPVVVSMRCLSVFHPNKWDVHNPQPPNWQELVLFSTQYRQNLCCEMLWVVAWDLLPS